MRRRTVVRALATLALGFALVDAVVVTLRDDARVGAASSGATASTPPRARASDRREPSLDRRCGTQRARLLTFRVAVQSEIGVSRFDRSPERFAADLLEILCHPRSWIAAGTVAFRYDPDAELVVRLLDPEQTEQRCLALVGLSVDRTYSCADSAAQEIVLNAARWYAGSPTWPGSITAYRHLLVNHEFGHVLGQRHVGCSGPGRYAPVMMQQSKGTDGCRPNAWPTKRELRRLVEGR